MRERNGGIVDRHKEVGVIVTQQKTALRKTMVKVAAHLEPELIKKIDSDRRGRGSCSRAAIVRMALMDRYRKSRR